MQPLVISETSDNQKAGFFCEIFTNLASSLKDQFFAVLSSVLFHKYQ
ncbi:hypothetical protein CFBP6109_05087 [Pseudomonas syringae pv. cerasicola]|uniref:Uncharacterized protein n=1 Tax=Pseudomonas savastanoi TaxID=29438 RepID=A0A3M5FA04_PSESS|nr:hypothetical protein ALP60_00900 [Pseudomonas savastanoi]RMS75230.1 hypothetical protein ALP61_04460 [Pseudomonas savastanoi]SOS22991.1 hypothetical protein CFBP6109_05087 [Pseudomonas syringae pv. cerasicola]SPF13332.1 hypothetical protein PSCFBP6110_00818 [Pseudomonas syringae pv. cerasicola]